MPPEKQAIQQSGWASLREDYLNQVQRDFLSRGLAVTGNNTPSECACERATQILVPRWVPRICDHCGMHRRNETALPNLLVACLCAQWCGTCNEYAPLFKQLQTEFPSIQFQWVDIEDESDLVDPVEVENFPTLLVTVNGHASFFGTVLPHVETLRRLVQSLQDDGVRPLANPEVQALAHRLLQRV